MYWPVSGSASMPGEPPGRALRVVAGDGDLRVTHAVTDQQDDVAGVAADDGLADGVGAVPGVAGGAAVLGELAGDGPRRAARPAVAVRQRWPGRGATGRGTGESSMHAAVVLPELDGGRDLDRDRVSSRPVAGVNVTDVGDRQPPGPTLVHERRDPDDCRSPDGRLGCATMGPRVVDHRRRLRRARRRARPARAGHRRHHHPRARRRGRRGLARQHLPRRGLRRAVAALLVVLGAQPAAGRAATPRRPRSSTTSSAPPRDAGLLDLVRTGTEVTGADLGRRDAPGGSPPTDRDVRRRRGRRGRRPALRAGRPATSRAPTPSPAPPSTPPSGATTSTSTGKRVAVVGTGASAIQLVPGIVDEVGAMTVFQRSAPYVVPEAGPAYSPLHHRLFRRGSRAVLAASGGRRSS